MGYYFPSLEIDVVCFRGFGGVRVSDRGVYVDFHAAFFGGGGGGGGGGG